MATFTAVNNGDGTATLQVRGVASGCTQVTIGFSTFAYNNVSLDVHDTAPNPGNNTYTCVFKNSSGGTLGSLSSSTNVTWPPGSVSAQVSGPYTGCSWSCPDDNNVDYTFWGTTLYYSVNGGAFQQYGATGAYGLSGNIGDPVYVGYSQSVRWEAVIEWAISGSPNASSSPTSGSVTTVAPPPPAPNPPSNGRITSDTGSAVALAWDASSGGATGYEIRRSSSGSGPWTTLADTGGTTYTDSSPGGTRPVYYEVLAYNSTSGGTTYSSPIVIAAATSDSCGILVG